ncbi:hypothetical protein [Burkholderia multivorans]|uniref:hypothetical protein n=1 Tax=Burkholderia multivorans TaxID=87883 RepID=UPI001C21C7B6|nr:hypothetical protein [Burkholderia multivorans]MBU9386647.1 hypothetical protein [Burkholderia multivorans]MBU9437081.1 hypothetical protein [Burkholderia multivorans]MBU9606286.1 hypothetical protein [Burkholderia multivorans]MBU9624845.1 hypothetical protein [Burkholderia multivorans]MDN7510990.1 hypothetical protein [Burkholderia multivorans]
MTIIKITGFSGEIPRLVPRLLPDTAAQNATNARLESGGLSPYRKPKFITRIADLPAGSIKTIYRNGPTWMAWDKPVYVAPGPVATDRLYVFGDGAPKMVVDKTTYPLAVPRPAAALTATINGSGTGDVYTRLYVYTFVTAFGEESEPCPISNQVNWQAGQTVTLSGFQAPPAGRNITKQRIYRSQTSLSGTDLYFIAERDASAANFVDNVQLKAQNEPLPSLEWNAPPDDLMGLISLPNGMMAAFRGKELWFCEPWRPHAWPEKYVLTMDYNIVALGAYGTTIVVATDGQPYIVSGASPDTMSQEKLELNLPCINARGLVDLGYAIAYPSHDGLVVASSAGARVVTDQLMTRNDWLRTAPDRFVSGQFFGRYLASYEYIDPSGKALRGSFIIDLTGQEAFLHRTDYKADATWYDISAGKLYLCIGQDIYEWDALDSENEILTWRSKQYVVQKPTNFGVILIEGSVLMTPEEEAAAETAREAAQQYNDSIFGAPSIGGEINGAALGVYPVNGDALKRISEQRFVSVTVYADAKPVATVSKLNRVCRLPAGFLAQTWEVEVSANADIAQVTLAGTGAELAGV